MNYRLGQFKVFGKGAKERLVPMEYATCRAILRYQDTARPQPVNPNETKIFLSVVGTPISQESVEKLVQRLRRRADIPQLHPHLFRHSFAVRYLINGGDVFTLQKILGHMTLEMTRRYVTLASGDVKEKHRLYSPIDNLGLAERQRGRPKALGQAAAALVKLRDALKLSDSRYDTLTKMYNEKPEALMIAHRKLDAAVFAAYGWPADLSDDETLCVARLLALNLERAAG